MSRNIFSSVLSFMIIFQSLILFAENYEFDSNEIFELTKITVEAEQNTFSIEAKHSEYIQQLPVRNMTELLHTHPSIHIQTSGDFFQPSIMTIRGSRLYQTQFLLDGIDLSTESDGTVDVSSIILDEIDSVEISNSPLSGLWGSNIGGMVYLKTKEIHEDNQIRANARVGSFRTEGQSVSLNYHHDDFSLLLIPAISRSDAGGEEDFNDGTRKNVILKSELKSFDSVFIKLLLGYIDSETRSAIYKRFNTRSEMTYDYAFYGLSFDFDSFFNIPDTRSSLIVSGVEYDLNNEFFFMSNGTSVPYNENISDESKQSFSYQVEYDLENVLVLFETKYSMTDIYSNLFDSSKDIDEFTVSGQIHKEFDENLFSQFFLRYDDHSTFGGDFSYGISFFRKNIMGFDLKILVSHDFNTPPLIYRYINQPVRMLKENPDLASEEANSIDLTISKKMGEFLEFSVTPFYQKLKDGVFSTMDTDGFFFYKNHDKVNKKGFEFNTKLMMNEKFITDIGMIYYKIYDEIAKRYIKDSGRMKWSITQNCKLTEKYSIALSGTYQNYYMSSIYAAKDKNFVFNIKNMIEMNEKSSFYFSIYNMFNTDQYWTDIYPNQKRHFDIGLSYVF